MCRQLVAAFNRHAVVCAQRSIIWGSCGKTHVLAQVIPTTATWVASVAGNSGLDRDAVANFNAGCFGTAGYNYAGGLVAENYGVFNNIATDATVLPVMDLFLC